MLRRSNLYLTNINLISYLYQTSFSGTASPRRPTTTITSCTAAGTRASTERTAASAESAAIRGILSRWVRLFQTCIMCCVKRSKIENFPTGCIFECVKNNPGWFILHSTSEWACRQCQADTSGPCRPKGAFTQSVKRADWAISAIKMFSS